MPYETFYKINNDPEDEYFFAKFVTHDCDLKLVQKYDLVYRNFVKNKDGLEFGLYIGNSAEIIKPIKTKAQPPTIK